LVLKHSSLFQTESCMFKLPTCIVIEFTNDNYRINLHVPYNVVINNIAFNNLDAIGLASSVALLTDFISAATVILV